MSSTIIYHPYHHPWWYSHWWNPLRWVPQFGTSTTDPRLTALLETKPSASARVTLSGSACFNNRGSHGLVGDHGKTMGISSGQIWKDLGKVWLPWGQSFWRDSDPSFFQCLLSVGPTKWRTRPLYLVGNCLEVEVIDAWTCAGFEIETRVTRA